ncbi:2357_t:CDS:2 [Entrophospora sp. SA101]|nr:2357_t:CDS:2 [Entrophospora sp. SA101]CAJ0825897.1 15529_t:CDS:2 [Entrophospora sp. SA101]
MEIFYQVARTMNEQLVQLRIRRVKIVKVLDCASISDKAIKFPFVKANVNTGWAW